ncbi:c-type cytochrome biogenesis protein CcmI [Rhodovulum sp. DZ06]|uniref:c-type cytochrome biogenesis protein CcmI n=1 Tax=Rhodovulum sp. DZ06 TaxID=3425126 RepID=UPI003D330B02
MLEFWATAAALAIAAALFLIRPLLSRGADAAPRAAHDMAVFRDQLAAVDADLERGVLSAAEAEGARAEVSRRLLAAAAEAERSHGAGPAPAGASRVLALVAVIGLLGGGAGLYFALGTPGQGDLPRAQRLADMKEAAANRPSQEAAEERIAARREASGIPEPQLPPEADRMLELVDRLRGILADRPDDVRGRRLLAQALMRLDDPKAAWRAQEEANALLGDAAEAADLELQAEAMVLAAEGYVSPEAEKLLSRTLALDPGNTTARYYAGLALAQNGRADLALKLWTELLREGGPDAPWKEPILRVIGDVAQEAGAPVPPEAQEAADALRAARGLPGPDADAMRDAAEMSMEDRREMIEGMVARLEDRLATEGGTVAEWGRLLRAYGVLAREGDIERIMGSARETFADRPEVLAELEAAAEAARAQAANGGAPQ